MSSLLNTFWGKLAWVHDPFNYLLSKIKSSTWKKYYILSFPVLILISLPLPPSFLPSSPLSSLPPFLFLNLGFSFHSLSSCSLSRTVHSHSGGPESWCPIIGAAEPVPPHPWSHPEIPISAICKGHQGCAPAPTMVQLAARCISPACRLVISSHDRDGE